MFFLMVSPFNFSDRLFNVQRKPCLCANKFEYFEPDFTQENELYRVDGQPINIINNAENVPFLQNVAQQSLVEVGSDSLPTNGLSDHQIAELATPRFIEVSELSDVANNQLKTAYEQFSKNDNL